MRRESLSQRCNGYCSWRGKAGIGYHACVSFMMGIRRTTWGVWRLRLEKRLHGCLKWRLSHWEWRRRMIAMLQRGRQPRRKHRLSAIKRLLHTERRGNTETGRRLSCLRSHSSAWITVRSVVLNGIRGRGRKTSSGYYVENLSLPSGYLTPKTNVSRDKPNERVVCGPRKTARATRQESSRKEKQIGRAHV